MPKERSINPAQAQRKAEKAKAIKKGKAEQAIRRNEKLSRQNPDRLQKQLDDLRAIESSGGKLTSHEKTITESLERDIKAIRKAREALGDKAPPLRRFDGRDNERERDGGRGGGVLGKRRRGDGTVEITGSDSDESDIPDDVARIPMPEDTPPPVPKEVLDKWYSKRRERLGISNNNNNRSNPHNNHQDPNSSTSSNRIPLGAKSRLPHQSQSQEQTPKETPVVAKTVYEAAPAIRDLRKEATSAAFVPAAVRAKIQRGKGAGGLLEPEEADRLEREGYLGGGGGSGSGSGERIEGREGEEHVPGSGRNVVMEEVEDEDD